MRSIIFATGRMVLVIVRSIIFIVVAMFLVAAFQALFTPAVPTRSVAAPSPSIESQPSKVFGKQDLPFIHSEYKANQARWFNEFKGTTFEATLTIESVREELIFSGFMVSFKENSNDYLSGVS
jgi:hypothetical protein